MDKRSMLDAMERILESSKVAVLATVDEHGQPRMRWMTPAVVRGRLGALYAVTSPNFDKSAQIGKNPKVEWILQSKSYDVILNVRGTISIVDNPAAKAEVQEAIGGHLSTFWKMNSDDSLVVLETEIEEITHLDAKNGKRTTVTIGA